MEELLCALAASSFLAIRLVVHKVVTPTGQELDRDRLCQVWDSNFQLASFDFPTGTVGILRELCETVYLYARLNSGELEKLYSNQQQLVSMNAWVDKLVKFGKGGFRPRCRAMGVYAQPANGSPRDLSCVFRLLRKDPVLITSVVGDASDNE